MLRPAVWKKIENKEATVSELKEKKKECEATKQAMDNQRTSLKRKHEEQLHEKDRLIGLKEDALRCSQAVTAQMEQEHGIALEECTQKNKKLRDMLSASQANLAI